MVKVPLKPCLPSFHLFPFSLVLSSLHSQVFVHAHCQFRGKLDPRAIKCIFIGYASNKKGYHCNHPPSRRFLTSMDVTFDETKSFYICPEL